MGLLKEAQEGTMEMSKKEKLFGEAVRLAAAGLAGVAIGWWAGRSRWAATSAEAEVAAQAAEDSEKK